MPTPEPPHIPPAQQPQRPRPQHMADLPAPRSSGRQAAAGADEPTLRLPAAALDPPPPPVPPGTTRPTADCTEDAREMAKLPRPVQGPQRGPARTGNHFPATRANQVIGYTTGRCCFNDIAAAIATATQPEHRIYIAGWWLQTDTWLRDQPPPPSTAPYLLSDFVKSTPAQVRTLTWRPPLVFGDIPNNQPWIDFVNGLPHGAALGDGKLPGVTTLGQGKLRVGVHHQKIVVVVGYRGTIAFVGGMDLNNTRISNQGVEPLHDVHVRLAGPGAVQVLKTFQERWMDHAQAAALEVSRFGANPNAPFRTAFPDPAPLTDTRVPSGTLPAGTHPPDRVVRIGRTYADLRKFGDKPVYAFAPDGEYSALDMLIDAIRQTRHTIYVEDQYLSSAIIRAELLKKLADKNFQYLLILMANSDAIKSSEFGYLRVFRNEYRRDLFALDPKQTRWGMYALKDCPDATRRWFAGSYVHSKTWIFDDEYVLTGSANCTDRSYTFDSEIVAGISESGFVPAGADSFATALRINLWHKHLGVPHSLVRDWRSGAKLWKKPPPSAMVYDDAQPEEDPLLGAKLPTDPAQERAVQTGRLFYDPDGLH
ncbi:phospholipase D-like domain-containing protein [Streptomyces sp. NPDC006733]|uniref:phospholipase D-like domain-containing protein n=1 Tax=Streptomyces sp. NPDC006733 TaxID=3155460 RepID=UPI0033FFAA97